MEDQGGPEGKWFSKSILSQLSMLNATIVPGISFYLAILNLFSTYSPSQYMRFLFIRPHSNGNMINLLVGAYVTHRAKHGWGSWKLISIFRLVAITSGIDCGANTRQIGATRCFAMVLLKSSARAKSGKVPISFRLPLD
jgi:hypothetical protein